MPDTTPKGLHAKLAEVMAEAGRIPKRGKAPQQMGGFEFVQVGDAADAIRLALGSRGVSMLPSGVEVIGEAEHQTRSGGTMTTLTVRTTWTLVDGETGQTATIQSLGTGADSGDKYSPKAQTNAMKYALLMGFLLSTGDDPEQHDTSDRQPRETTQDGVESLEFLGNIKKAGRIAAGTATMYKAEWREDPDGDHAIGFRLHLDGEDKDIPQVLVGGEVGEALYIATSGQGASLVGQRVTVGGRLYAVRQPGRTTYYRLVIGEVDDPARNFVETPEFRIPALDIERIATPDGVLPAPLDSAPAAVEEPSGAEPIAPGQVGLDLTEDEKVAIAGGLP